MIINNNNSEIIDVEIVNTVTVGSSDIVSGVEDVIFNGESIVEDNIANINKIVEQELTDTHEKIPTSKAVLDMIDSLRDGTIIDAGLFIEDVQDIIDGGQF